MIKKGRATKYLILEAALAVCLLAAAIGIRIYNMPTEAYGLGVFFDAASVDSRDAVGYVPGTGITQVYLYMLRGLFLIFGNIWQVGTMAQLILFFIGAIVFYLAVRKVTGSIGSIFIVAGMLCLPCFLPITYSYGPQMLYFLLFSVCLYYVHSWVKGSSEREDFGVLFIVPTILIGLYIGLLCYLDIFGVILLLPMLFFPYIVRNNAGIGKGVALAFLLLVSAILCFFSCAVAEGMLSGVTMEDLMLQWLLYGVKIRHDMHIWLGIFMVATYAVNLVYFLVYMIFKRTTRQVRELDVEALLQNQIETEVKKESEAVVQEVTAQVKEISVEGEVKEEDKPQEEMLPSVNFIENPLPLPKKHVKKSLDYAFQPDFEDMDYDIKVSENDDYDLK